MTAKDGPDLQDDRLVVATLVFSVVLFGIVNEVLRYLSQRCAVLKMTSQWRWRNLAVSWLHADVCAVGCFYCYFAHGHKIQTLSDLMDFTSVDASILVAFSTGYFMYDFLDHGRQGKFLTLWEVTAHHVAVIFIFGYNLAFHFSIAFSNLALMVEINSVFLHGRKLLQMLEVPFSHWLYRTTVALNIATFVVFRGLAMVLIWTGFIFNLHRCSAVYIVSLGTVMVFMVILNPVLLWRLVKSDLFRKRPLKVKDEEKRKNEPENGRTAQRWEQNGQIRFKGAVQSQC